MNTKPMKPRKPKPVIHLRPIGQPSAWRTACGLDILPNRENGVQISSIIHEATCLDCFTIDR